MLVGRMWDWPVGDEETDLGVFVGERDAGEESSLCGVCVPVIRVVAPSAADDYHLAANWWGVRWFCLDDGGLKYQGAWW